MTTVKILNIPINQIGNNITVGVYASIPTGKLARTALNFKNEVQVATHLKSGHDLVLLTGSDEMAQFLKNNIESRNLPGTLFIVPVSASDHALI